MRILILEDDTALCAGIELTLKGAERRFALCHSLAEARAVLVNGSPDLFILDINLPDGSGLDFCAELRAAGNKSPVLMLTANDTELERIWQDGTEFVDENALSVAVRRLRAKLEADPSNPRYIKTIHGIGYKWAVEL